MNKTHKVMATALTATMLLSFALPALADNSSTTAPSTGQVQTAPATGSSVAAQRAAKRKAWLQNQIIRIQKKQEFQQYLGPIHQLQSQDKQLRGQIRSLRQQIRQQIRTDRQAKNYTALLAALNDMIPMQDDISSAIQAASTCKSDWTQLQSDNKAKDTQAMGADLQKIETDIQTRISVYQKILADLQKINQDLNLANNAAANSPSGSTSSGTVAQ